MNDAESINVSIESIEDGLILKPIGEIDLSRAPSLRQHISKAQSGNHRRLIIDLAEVGYMDSSGVATLVEAMQVARRKGQRLVLCQLQQKVRSIFEIARLDSVFIIAASRDQAIKS